MEPLFQDSYETSSFDSLSFERKLVELVEELRLRRSLEIESEKTLKSVLDEKYKMEMDLDELRRSYAREKADYEQQITLFKRKLDDKLCVSDDEKAKQVVVNKTYSQEIRVLKEELRSSHSEKLKLVKRVQELEGQLKLHNNFQETIVKQIGEMRNRSKVLAEECMQLKKFQESVLSNVTEINTNFNKFEVCYHHLRESISISDKRNEFLKKELISTRAEISVLKNKVVEVEGSSEKKEYVSEWEEKILEQQNMVLFSRRENEKTLKSLSESNKHLCKYMNKYSESQALEKELQSKLEKYGKDEIVWKTNMRDIKVALASLKEENSSLKEELMKITTITSKKEENHSKDNLPNGAGIQEDEVNHNPKSDGKTDSIDEINSRKGENNRCFQETETRVTSNPEDVTQSMLESVSSFCKMTKRKFDEMDDEEEDTVTVPFKKPNIEQRRDWTLVDRSNSNNPLFVQEVSSSIEDISLSQDENQEIGRGDGCTNSHSNLQVGDTELRDLVNVQMNLRELKMNDADEKEKDCMDEEKKHE